MPEIVQDIGAYAGLASVLGLAVLSVLYFSQARDVKRLREWAGRAPERAEEGTPAQVTPVPGRAAPQAQAKPAAPAVPGAPKAPGVPAPAAAAAKPAAVPGPQAVPGAKPAAPAVPAAPAAGTAAAPAAAQAKPAPAEAKPGAQEAPAPTGGKPAVPEMAAATGAGAAAATAAAQGKQASPTGAGAANSAPTAPPAPKPFTTAAAQAQGAKPPGPKLPPRAPSQQTVILPPPREPWYRRLLASPRTIVLVIAGVLVLGGGAAFAITQITSDDADSGGTQPAQDGGIPQQADEGGEESGADEGGDDGQRNRRPAVNPSRVTVAVLNGTTVPGLAAKIATEVEGFGFQIGTVANGPERESQRAESVVMYSRGHEREAVAVGRRLKITQREPVDPESQGLAGDATVVVIAGGDRG